MYPDLIRTRGTSFLSNAVSQRVQQKNGVFPIQNMPSYIYGDITYPSNKSNNPNYKKGIMRPNEFEKRFVNYERKIEVEILSSVDEIGTPVIVIGSIWNILKGFSFLNGTYCNDVFIESVKYRFGVAGGASIVYLVFFMTLLLKGKFLIKLNVKGKNFAFILTLMVFLSLLSINILSLFAIKPYLSTYFQKNVPWFIWFHLEC